MLLYANGVLFQVLEGEKNAVLTLYAHIVKDVRHNQVRKLAVRDMDQRDFPEWTMGFANPNPSDLSKNTQLDRLLAPGFDVDAFTGEPTHAKAMLKAFRESVLKGDERALRLR